MISSGMDPGSEAGMTEKTAEIEANSKSKTALYERFLIYYMVQGHHAVSTTVLSIIRASL